MSSLLTSINIICVVSEWTILLGYTLATCPILIKVGAINKLSHHSRRFQRFHIDGRKLKRYPFYICMPVLLFLIIWTIIDMPKSRNSLSLQDGGVVDQILVNKYCASSFQVWTLFAHAWQIILIFVAVVLVFQSGHVVEEMSESQSLMHIVYAQFLALILRIIVIILSRNGFVHISLAPPLVSSLLSLDVISHIIIYMGPKFYVLCRSQGTNTRRTSTESFRFSQNGKSLIRSSLKSAFEKLLGMKIIEDASNDSNFSRRMNSVMMLRKTGVNLIKAPSTKSSPGLFIPKRSEDQE